MASNVEIFLGQQEILASFIEKGSSVVSGVGYEGTAPSYVTLAVDITELASAVFKSADIYRPNTNVGYKEIFDTVVANNRFSNSIGYSRADYYTMAGIELEILSGLHRYTQNVINKLIEVPA